MEHDVPRNRIAYGFHPSLCVKRSAYGTELAEQIMSGQFQQPCLSLINATAQIHIPHPFVRIHCPITITTSHKQIHICI